MECVNLWHFRKWLIRFVMMVQRGGTGKGKGKEETEIREWKRKEGEMKGKCKENRKR